MAKLKIVIDPLALVVLFLFIYFGWLDEVLFYVVALFMHEYAHYFVAKKLGYNLNLMTFSPFGASLSGSNNYFKKSHEILIAIAGPMLNLAMIIIIVALWWILPDVYIATYSFVLANASLLITNMLPLFPLDAGRIVLVLVKDNAKFRKIYKIYQFNSILISIVLIILFIASAFSKLNLSYLFIAVLLISSLFNIKNSVYYDYSYLDKDYDSILPIKEFFVPLGVNKYRILKFINKHAFSIFHFVDKSGNIIRSVNEKQLIQIINNNEIDKVLNFERNKN